MIKIKQTENSFLFELIINSEKIGECLLSTFEHNCKIESLFVEKEHRGKGYAKELTQKVIDFCIKKKRGYELFLWITPHKKKKGLKKKELVKFYQKLGFDKKSTLFDGPFPLMTYNQ